MFIIIIKCFWFDINYVVFSTGDINFQLITNFAFAAFATETTGAEHFEEKLKEWPDEETNVGVN